jgi:zinc transport system substrate-binding protein
MKTLEHTDAFIINGGGMESFLEDVVENYPSLTVMNAGKNLEDIAEELEHAHIHEPETEKEEQNGDKTEQKEEIHGLENNIEENGHNHEEEANAHFWLNPEYYIIQIQTVADELSAFDSEHAAKYQQNAEAYIKKVEKLATQLKALNVPNTGAIVFHDAFVYLAEYLGLEVIRTIEIDSETALSAGDIAEIIEEIKKGQVSILFTEAQYSTEAADTISKETGVSSYTIDSLVTGENNKDAYLTGMEKNIAILKNAFSGND